MNKAAQEIRIWDIEFSNNHSQLIDNTIETVRKQVLFLWEKTRENINKYIYSSLNKIFCWKIQINKKYSIKEFL